MVTRLIFTLFVATVAIQRLLEVIYSRRNERILFEHGGREHAAGQLRPMKLLHTAWLMSAVAEVWLLAPPFRAWLAIAALAIFALGQACRLLAMRALGHRKHRKFHYRNLYVAHRPRSYPIPEIPRTKSFYGNPREIGTHPLRIRRIWMLCVWRARKLLGILPTTSIIERSLPGRAERVP